MRRARQTQVSVAVASANKLENALSRLARRGFARKAVEKKEAETANQKKRRRGARRGRINAEDAAKLDAERAPSVKAWEQSLHEKGFWRAPEAIPESLDSKINSNAPAGQQLDELEGWLDRQKDHDAGDWPTGEFTGGKHDRHDSSDKV